MHAFSRFFILSGTLYEALQMLLTEQCLEDSPWAEIMARWLGWEGLRNYSYTHHVKMCFQKWIEVIIAQKEIYFYHSSKTKQEYILVSSNGKMHVHQKAQLCHLKMIPILMCKATEAKSWMSTGWGADCHWLLHLHNMIILHLKVWCWQHFFCCCSWRTRTMDCKLEFQGNSVMLCLNISLKWNVIWHSILVKQIWLPSHFYTMLAAIGPWKNSILCLS